MTSYNKANVFTDMVILGNIVNQYSQYSSNVINMLA